MVAEPPEQGTESRSGSNPAAAPAPTAGLSWLWAKIKRHKVVEWTLAYIAFAYAFLHGAEMLSDAQQWPHAIVHVLSLALILGVPIVSTLAWYHGHRAQHRISGPEIVIVTLLLVITGSMLWWLSGSHGQKQIAATESAAPRQTPIANALSIIVLPFVNQTGDSQKEYIADAITSSVTSDLSRIRDAYVVPAPTAFTYKDKSLTVRQVAEDARVRFVLSGNVQSAGTQARISAELLDGTTGVQIWDETFNGELTDLFALQDRVTTLVGNGLGREMVIAAARDTQKQATNAQSTDLLLRARALDLRPSSTANYKQMEDIYRELLKREPDNATVITGLATTLTKAASLGLYTPKTAGVPIHMFAEAEALAEHARELDFNSPDIDYVLGYASMYRGDFNSAERFFKARLEQEPKNPEVYNILGILTYAEFKPQQALDLFKRAADLTPGPADDIDMSIAYMELGDYDAAIDSVERALEVSPHLDIGFGVAALAYALKGNNAAATKWADKARIAHVVPADVVGFPVGSEQYERWAKTVFLPTWRRLGLPE